jgi:hypothetical protein
LRLDRNVVRHTCSCIRPGLRFGNHRPRGYRRRG